MGPSDFVFRVMMVGDMGVGKTSILERYSEDTFTEAQKATLKLDIVGKMMMVGDKSIKLQIWDTVGCEAFRSLTQAYYRSASAIVLVYDVTNLRSFQHLSQWISDIDRLGPDNLLRVLVGNKSDMEQRVVTSDMAAAFCQQHDIIYLETSAKNSANITDLFTYIAEYLTKYPVNAIERSMRTMRFEPKPEKNRLNCCSMS